MRPAKEAAATSEGGNFSSLDEENLSASQYLKSDEQKIRKRPISRKSLADLHLHILKEMHTNRGPTSGVGTETEGLHFSLGTANAAMTNGVDGESERRFGAGNNAGSGIGVMHVDGSGVTQIGRRQAKDSSSSDVKSGENRRESTLWQPLGCNLPVGSLSGGAVSAGSPSVEARSPRPTNVKLTPLSISNSNFEDSSFQNSTSSTQYDRQHQQQLESKEQQQQQQQQQQPQQETMKLWKRFGDPTPLSPVTPNQSYSFAAMRTPMTPNSGFMSPMTPTSGLILDKNDPFISAFMKRIPDAKFDERTGTLSGVTMWFLGKLNDLDTKMLSKGGLESLFTEEEIKGFRKVFATFDTGGRGRLDREQIGALMEAAEMNVTAERTDFLFELMDKNRSGFVEWEDFLVHMYKDKLERIDRIFTSAASAKSASEVAKAEAQNASFNDPKNAGPDLLEATDCWESTMLSGLISAEQLHHALVQNGNTHYTMAQVRRLVSLYDDDRDGYLDREDLMRML